MTKRNKQLFWLNLDDVSLCHDLVSDYLLMTDMEIIRGWMRIADRADCGGTVAEGSESDTNNGIAYTFQGARMSCNKNCTISEGYPASTLSNGAAQVLDGHLTSNGCRLISTLNGIDGVADD